MTPKRYVNISLHTTLSQIIVQTFGHSEKRDTERGLIHTQKLGTVFSIILNPKRHINSSVCCRDLRTKTIAKPIIFYTS